VLRFLLLTLTLCLGCALIIGAAVAVERVLPPSEAIQWLHMKDCESPCLMGVTIGKTQPEAVRASVTQAAALPGYTLTSDVLEGHAGLILSRSTQESLVINFYFKDEVVDFGRVSFTSKRFDYFHGNSLTFADLINLYAAPTCAYELFDGIMPVSLLYFEGKAYEVTALFDHPMTWTSSVKGLTIQTRDGKAAGSCTYAPSRWRGVAAKYPAVD